MFFFFKQKTAYEMSISDWSSDVCSSDLSVNKQDVEELTKAQRIAFDCLVNLHSHSISNAYTKGVHIDVWRDETYKNSSGKTDAKRQAFKRSKDRSEERRVG